MKMLPCVAVALLVSMACSTQAGGSAQPSSTVPTMQSDIRQTGSALVWGLEFDRGQASWPAASNAPLEQVLLMLQQHTEWRFEVEVRTDELGNVAADQALTDRRAEAVVAWLIQRGIDSARLVPRGLGSARPRQSPMPPSSPVAARWVELRKLNEE
jgi:OmpA-OmpF porin, OOP family